MVRKSLGRSLRAMTDVSVTRDLPASADDVWAMVADITRMGEWSPEATGGKWLGGATGPALGARFKGSNAKGRLRWSTTCTITECEPGKVFTFAVKSGPLPVATWSYRFEPTETGCRVTETWTNQSVPAISKVSGRLIGVPDRAAHNRSTMEATLDALAAAVA